MAGRISHIVLTSFNCRIFKERINRIGAVKIKLLSIKRFLGKKLKLKGFLI